MRSLFGLIGLLILFGEVMAAPPSAFTDINRTHPHYLSIAYFSGQGVLSGYADARFKPEAPINRAESLKLILTGSGISIDNRTDSILFNDVKPDDWFAPLVVTAHRLGVVAGDGNGGAFSAARPVNKAELIKMLFTANAVQLEPVLPEPNAFLDVPPDAWFAPSLYYAARHGIIEADSAGQLNPARPLTRGEVVEVLYLFTLIKKGSDTQFLLDQTEDQLAQIEVYVAANRVDLAKRASNLGVGISQQALKNMPGSPVVLGAAKLARAYDFLVDAFQLGVSRQFQAAADKANQAIVKASEAWQANNATQPIARHIKDRAREILAQVGGQELPAATVGE